MTKLIDSFMAEIERMNDPAVKKAKKILNKVFKEDADGDVTSASNIADVRERIPMKKKVKKTKIGHGGDGPTHDGGCKRYPVHEDATAGSTNAADFSNDFGTDTPRLPTVTGSLDGNKSMGMWGGTSVITMSMFNAFLDTGKKKKVSDEKPIHYALNTDYEDKAEHSGHGDSTTLEPVKRSPFDAYVPSQKFVFSADKIDKIERRAGVERELKRRQEAKKLTAIAKQAYLDSIDTIKPIDPVKSKDKVDSALKKYSDTGKVGKDEKKPHTETDPRKGKAEKELQGPNSRDVKSDGSV